MFVKIPRIVLLILAVAGLIATVAPADPTHAWYIRFLDYPRLEFMIAMIAIAVLLFLLPKTKWSLLAIFCMAGCAAYDASILWSYTAIAHNQERAAGNCPSGNELRVLEVNVLMTNRHDHTLREMVQKIHPDVAWFQETNDWWRNELSALRYQYPYHVVNAQPNYFGVDLYSRFPLIDPEVKFLTGSANPSIFTGVQLPSGQVIKFYAMHPRPPSFGLHGTKERDAQLMAMALAARGDSEPHVTAGDMNSVPWEDVIHDTERVGRFLDPRIGRGLYITWDAHNPIAKWPLDQILPGPGMTLISLQVLPQFGSDHHPYFAQLCVDPSAASRQQPPSIQPGDLAQAERTVSEGQEKADMKGYKGRYGPDGKRTD